MYKKCLQLTFFSCTRVKPLISPYLLPILGHRIYFLIYFIMTKQDLVAAVAAGAGVSKRVAGDALEAVLEAITKELKKGKNVTITGFGTFRVSKRAARTGVNPRNPSQKIKIPAMNVPAFKAGKSLKDAVR